MSALPPGCGSHTQVPVDRPLVHLGHHVVNGLAVAERLVNREVEAVEKPELELVGALEEG